MHSEGRQQAYGAHLDYTREDGQFKGELELGVSELATAGVGAGGIRAHQRSCPLKQIDTLLQPQHFRRALDEEIKRSLVCSKTLSRQIQRR